MNQPVPSLPETLQRARRDLSRLHYVNRDSLPAVLWRTGR